MKIPGIEAASLNGNWPMRIRPWLDINKLEPVYSVETLHPDYKVWLAVYAKGRGLKRFKSKEAAKKFIADTKSAADQSARKGE